MTPFTAGPLEGKWTLTKRSRSSIEKLTELPPGRYHVRAFYDPASTLDTIVAFIILDNTIWRGLVATNSIEVDLPLKVATAAALPLSSKK